MSAQVLPWRGRQRVRLRQEQDGIPVLGSGGVVEVGADGTVRAVSVAWRDGLPPVAGALLEHEEAVCSALAALPAATRATAADLVLVPDGEEAWPAWVVALRGDDAADAWRAFVDARDGTLRRLLPDRLDARGRVFLTESTTDDLAEVDLAGLHEGATSLSGDVVEAVSLAWVAGTATEVQRAEADAGGGFLYEPDQPALDDPFAEVNAYHHARSTWDYFAEVHDHPVPDRVDVVVNYRTERDSPYDNAFFIYGDRGGYLLTFGQGTDTDWSYSPGVVIHEFSHGIVEDVTRLLEASVYPVNMDDYGLHPAPGGLTEGLPDYWAATRHGHSVQATWADGTPIRDLDNDATCPESIYGEAHADGEVVGGATWEIREALGAEASDQVVYGAMGLLGGSPTYADFAQALVAAAEAVAEDGLMDPARVETVQAIVEARGPARCGRSVPLDEVDGASGVFLGADIVSESLCEFVRNADIRITTPFQYAYTVPDDDPRPLLGLDFAVAMEATGGRTLAEGDLDYVAYVAQDGLVHYQVEELDVLGYVFPLPGEPDDAVGAWDESPTSFQLRASDLGLDALPPGSEWILSIAGMNCKTVSYSLTVTPVWGQVPTELVGCTGWAGARAAFLPLLGLGALARRGRRRRGAVPDRRS